MDSEFRSFLDLVDTAHDERMISHAARNYAQGMGFERFAYLQVEGADVKTINTYPGSWHDTYLEHRLSIVDPVVIEARRRMSLFSWSADNWSSRGSPDLKRFRDSAVSHGICSGTTIPVRGSLNSTIMLTFATSSPQIPNSACLNTETAVHAALAIHYRLRFVASGCVLTPKRLLSPKEAACVNWAARGKPGAEIATILGIAPRTVQHYLDSAREKLGAANVQHLTALATAHGMVEF